MQLETLILADAVSAPPDGKFYVLGGGITRFNVVQLPMIAQLGVFARLQFDENEPLRAHRIEIHFLDPDGIDVLKGGPDLQTPEIAEPPQLAEGEQRFIALAINMSGVPIRQYGMHLLRILADGETMREVPLPATPIDAAPGHLGPFLLPHRQPDS
jgi:hypothetical protein